MKCNVGTLDRIIRAILGIILLVLPFLVALGAAIKWLLIIVGIILLFTAAVGFCPPYLPFGINTCRRE